MTEDQKKLLNGFAIFAELSGEYGIEFVRNKNQRAPIRIHISDLVEPGEELTFFMKLAKAAWEVEDGEKIIRVLSPDVEKPAKTRPTKVSRIERIANTELKEKRLEVLEFDPNIQPSKDTNENIAALVQHLYLIWRSLPGGLRKPNRIRAEAIRGYMKQRENGYSHDQIVKGLKVYGQWAEAKEKAMANMDIDSFWFHRWDFHKFMSSNTALDHVDGGWRELVMSKGIPSEYANLTKVSSDKIFKKNVKHIAAEYLKWGEFGVNDTNLFNQTPGLKEAVLKKVEELKNAS